MSNLVKHAERELKLYGYPEYDGMIDEAVLELIKVFAKQGHSGMSASITRLLFGILAEFKPLTPLTDNSDEWVHHGGDIWGETGGIWQNVRQSDAFSTDGGKTYYILSEKTWFHQHIYIHLPQPWRVWVHKKYHGWLMPYHKAAT